MKNIFLLIPFLFPLFLQSSSFDESQAAPIAQALRFGKPGEVYNLLYAQTPSVNPEDRVQWYDKNPTITEMTLKFFGEQDSGLHLNSTRRNCLKPVLQKYFTQNIEQYADELMSIHVDSRVDKFEELLQTHQDELTPLGRKHLKLEDPASSSSTTSKTTQITGQSRSRKLLACLTASIRAPFSLLGAMRSRITTINIKFSEIPGKLFAYLYKRFFPRPTA